MPSPERWLGLIGLCLGVFMFTLDASIVNVALPTLVAAFGTTFSTIQWVVLGYLLIATALVMAAARLGDIHGKKRAYLAGLAIFTLGSLLCGMAPSAGWLIACRAVQGLGAVFVSALGAAIVGEMFATTERGRALGMIGSAVLLGVALGPSVGGFIIAWVGWRWMFFVNIPVGIVAMSVVFRFVPDIPGRPASAGLDWPGTVLACVMLGGMALGLTWGQRDGFETPLVVGLLATAIVALAAFLYVEPRVASPILDLRVFRNKPFATGLLMGYLVFLVLGGTGFLLPFFLEVMAHYPTAKVGLLLAISPIVGGVTAPIGGALADRVGPRWVALSGLLLVALGCVLFTSIDEHVTVWGFALRVAPVGLGMGLFNAANNSSVLNAVPRDQLGIASALLSLMRTLGQTTGVPVIASIFSLVALGETSGGRHHALLTLPAESLLRGLHWAFIAAAGLSLAAFAAGAWELKQRRRAAAAKA
ncbi:MAG TPA: DHA2 family efflux MFS transporter permease subunit [Burkholderiales bacterium]|nr:DHA2 family efflux MFS transporter permease subunit [Burkholderiales bacterium]